MEKCKYCSLEAEFKLRDKKTREEFFICSFCEPVEDIEIVEDLNPKSIDPKQSLENLDRTLGRLHFVRKGKKTFPCRECHRIIEIGESSFTQSLKEGKMYFPIQSRLCNFCAKNLIKDGTIYVGINKEDLEKLS